MFEVVQDLLENYVSLKAMIVNVALQGLDQECAG